MSQRNCKRCGTEFKSLKRVHVFCALHCAQEWKAEQYRDEINRLMAEGQIPATRMEASFMGAKFYFTGQPCQKGHLDVRLTHSKNCVVCTRIKHGKDNEHRRLAKAKKPEAVAIAPNESLLTSPVWLHILPNWQAVVVQRA